MLCVEDWEWLVGRQNDFSTEAAALIVAFREDLFKLSLEKSLLSNLSFRKDILCFFTAPRALGSKWEGRLGLLVPLHKGTAYLVTLL